MIRTKDYIFIRHGEHPANSNQESEYLGGLTLQGLQEAKIIGEKIDFEDGYQPEALCVARERFVTTVTLALAPEISVEEVELTAKKFIASRRIIIDSELDYKVAPPSFINELNDAFIACRGLEYLVNSDRDDRWRNNTSISTGDSMARVVASKIKIENNKIYEGKLICAREFFYPSLRAKLIERVEGIHAMNDYIEWYGHKVEWNPHARTQIQTIQVANIRDNMKLLIKDEYADSEYPIDILDSM